MVPADGRETAPVNSRRIAISPQTSPYLTARRGHLARVSRVPVYEPLLT